MKKTRRPIEKTRKKASARARPVARKPRPALHFDKAFEALNEGFYEWNIADGSTYYSDRVLSAVGLSRRDLKTSADWHKRIHPDDRAAYDAALAAHFKRKTERFECDFRFRAGDGSWRWARQHGIAIRDARGRASRMVGSTGDITEWKRMEQALRESQQRYELATSAALEGIYEWDLASNDLYLSERWKQFLGLPEGAHTPAAWNERVHPEDFPAYRQAVIDCFKGTTPRLELEYRIRHPSGGWMWILDHAVAVRDAKGRATKFVGAVSDIDRRKQAEIELRRARDEAHEALERQTATAEILKVIAGSPSNVQPVLDAVAASAARLCDARDAIILLREDDSFRFVAHFGSMPNLPVGGLRKLTRNTVVGRAILEGRQFHVPDLQSQTGEFPEGSTYAREFGYRTSLVTPLLREGKAIGAIMIRRAEMRPFDDKQVDLVRTFADQAVIAIENVRLFNETKEALERQTATSEILKVIASSPSDVQPVFEAIARSSRQLLGGLSAAVGRVEDGRMHLAAYTSTSRAGDDALKSQFPMAILRERPLGRVVIERAAFVRVDTESDPQITAAELGMARARGYRSIVAVPMMREGAAIGAISVTRPIPGPFPEHQIELLKTFADQAVIAIENVRLFNETKEALERQTATSAVLRVISSSPNDLAPVFGEILERAMQLCEAELGFVFASDGQAFDPVAQRGLDEPQYAAWTAAMRPHRVPGPLSGLGRLLATKAPVLIADVADDDAYRRRDPLRVLTVEAIGARTFVAVPLLKDAAVIGAVVIYRREVRPFSEKQVSLLQTFGDQAVIAIENARLFNEIQESLEQQKASGEVLGAISSSIADTKPVFDKILDSCERLFAGRIVGLNLVGADGLLRLGAYHGAHREEFERIFPLPVTAASGSGLAIAEARVVHYPDAADESVPERTRQGCESIGIKSVIFAPLLWKGRGLGAIFVGRDHVSSFSEKEIALLKTFADQAVIAIENVRLFNETKESLERQTATSEILKVISSSPTDVQPVFDEIAVHAATLSGARFAFVTTFDGEWIQMRSTHGEGAEEHRSGYPIKPGGDAVSARVVRDRAPVQIEDVEKDAEYVHKDTARRSGFRSVFGVPMMREGSVLGAITLARPVAGRVPDKLVYLLQTFADQAVIAIENVRLFNETKESLERQTATAEILRVIASSPDDVQPVFDAIAASATRLIGGFSTGVGRLEAGQIHLAALTTTSEAGDAALRRVFPLPLQRAGHLATAIRTGAPQMIVDVQADPDAPDEVKTTARARGWRSAVATPMLRGTEAIGVINVTRTAPGTFSNHEIDLLKTFADQAVIAIENVRLFNETKEALERQTATAEILKVISSSPTDVQPVFDAIVESCTRLLACRHSTLRLIKGDQAEIVASNSALGGIEDDSPMPLFDDSLPTSRAVSRREVVQIPDTSAEGVSARIKQRGEQRGFRSLMIAPMLRDNDVVGTLHVHRAAPGRFTEKEVALLETFASQAVIAIENVRLFTETKEALERQTATAEILKVISSSPTDEKPVFDAIVQSAARLFRRRARIRLIEGGMLHLQASSDAPGATALSDPPFPLTPESIGGRVFLERIALQISDTEAPGAPTWNAASGRAVGYRAIAAAPLMRKNEVIGAIGVTSPDPGTMSEKEMSMLMTFADQAVIAIENVRLFKELEHRTEALQQSVQQLTALGEVGQAISSTLDLEKVLKTIVTHALQLTGLYGGSIYEYDEASEQFHLQAAENMDEEVLETIRRVPIRKGDGTVGGTAITLEPMQVPDILAESYTSSRKELLVGAGYRAVLTVPLLREGRIIGALSVTRKTPGPFAPEIVELLKTFATQSAMAIQNARLFREIAEKGRQLEEASKHKSQFLASMSHELRTPLNAILGFNEMLLGEVYGDVPADMKEPLADIQSSGKHLLRLINNVLDLAKIEAGRMELALGDYSVHDTVESVRSTLRPLAEAKGLDLRVEVPADLPLAHGDSGRITQCLMNLAGNSLKFTKQGSVGISVALANGTLTWKVQDTGIGIPADKIGSLFTEFKQTDATIASEYGGTGLGLSISKKFIEMHGGRIWAESEPGSGSTFIFEVPLRASEGRQA